MKNIRLNFCIFILLMALALNNVFPASKSYLKIGKTENIESEGIQFKSIDDFNPSPIPLPERIGALVNRQTGEKKEMYSSEDLWRIDQFIGIWQSNIGNLKIAKISLPYPEEIGDKDGIIDMDSYKEWKEKQPLKINFTADEINKWVRKFFDLESLENPEILTRQLSPRDCRVSFFKQKSRDPKSPVYIFLIESQKFPALKIAVSYTLNDTININIEKSEDAIFTSIKSFTFSPPKKLPLNQSKQQTINKNIKRSPEYIISREQVINNIKNAKGWEYLETENFILVYNLRNSKTVKEISQNLESCRAVFETFYPLKKELKAVSVCRLFEKREDYLNYVGKEYEWTGGLWNPSRKELIISPIDWMTKSNNRKAMVKVVFHEGFHQYLHYATDEAISSIWFNEGNATFFEGINFKGNQFEIELTDRLNEMKKLASLKIDIKSFLYMEQDEFVKFDISKNYTLAWGLMFFLHKGSKVIKKENNYSEIPYKYYEVLLESKNYKKATDEAWKNVDFQKFEEDFKAFWTNDSLIKKAERYNFNHLFSK